LHEVFADAGYFAQDDGGSRAAARKASRWIQAVKRLSVMRRGLVAEGMQKAEQIAKLRVRELSEAFHRPVDV